MSTSLNVVTRTEPSATVIELHGDVSADGQGPISGAYEAAVAAGASTVLFNLSETKYINTSGISVLIAIVMGAKKAGINVLVAGALLAGQRSLRERCGDGVAVASGWRAANELAAGAAMTPVGREPHAVRTDQ